MSSLELDEEKRRSLEELRSRMSELLQPRHDDKFLLRWLRARDYNVDAAEKMLREDFRFRKKIGTDTIVQDYKLLPAELREYTCDGFVGFDKYGHAVRFYHGGCSDLKGFVRSMTYYDCVRYFICNFESDWQRMQENNLKTGKQAEKFVFLIDMTGFRSNQWCDRNVIRTSLQLLSVYQDHYPESMYVTYIFNAPSLFYYLFNMFKPLFNEVILSKIKLYGVGDDSWQKEVFSFVPREVVPAYLGGSLYDPDAKCSAFLRWNKKIPTSFYVTETSDLKSSDPCVKQKLVRERSHFEVERDVEKPGSTLSWEFQTKDRNLKFGLFYKKKTPTQSQSANSRSGAEKEELIPVDTVECHEFVEKGQFECTKPGTYVLHFDNTFSWLRSKHLLYKVEVRPPQTPTLDL